MCLVYVWLIDVGGVGVVVSPQGGDRWEIASGRSASGRCQGVAPTVPGEGERPGRRELDRQGIQGRQGIRVSWMMMVMSAETPCTFFRNPQSRPTIGFRRRTELSEGEARRGPIFVGIPVRIARLTVSRRRLAIRTGTLDLRRGYATSCPPRQVNDSNKGSNGPAG